MHEPRRSIDYRKDPKQELDMKNLNDLLAPVERKMIAHFDTPVFPVVFIIGAPRSGSTLLSQILAQTGSFSYITNFVARFWMAPYMGMLLQNVVDTDDSTSNQSFSSDFGRTKGSYGPHEFGYFWSRWFHFDRTHKVEVDELLQIDHRQLKREIAALENVRGNPMVFKNLTCGLQIPFLAQIIKNAFFVLCQRHPLYAMQSLLIAREKIHGNLHKWWSLRPKEYPNLISLTPYEQVAGQIYFILEDIKKNLLQLPSEQFMIIHYEDLCENPRREVDRFISSINACGEAISWAREKIPEHFCSKNAQKVGDHHFNKLYEAFQQCFTTPLT